MFTITHLQPHLFTISRRQPGISTLKQVIQGDIFTQRQPDMFTIVDDESKSPRSTDATLVLNWHRNLGEHPNLTAVEGDELAFVVTHFADKVKQTICTEWRVITAWL